VDDRKGEKKEEETQEKKEEKKEEEPDVDLCSCRICKHEHEEVRAEDDKSRMYNVPGHK
jgi:hypothetical protein